MISQYNKEIRLTLPKAQAEWLEKTCKKASISKSKYISWCLAKKAEELLKILNLNSVMRNYSPKEIKEITEPEKTISDAEISDLIEDLENLKSRA